MTSAYYDERMRRGWFVATAMAAGACVAIACGSDRDDRPANGNLDAGSDGPEAAATDAAMACPLSDRERGEVRGVVTILDGSKTPPPAPGARVCVHGRPDLPCVDALADGTYEHTCMPVGDVAILFSHEAGRTLWLRVLLPGFPQLLDAPIANRAENVKLFSAVGIAYPQPGMGIVTLNDALNTTTGGFTVSVPPGILGPWYSSNGTTITHDAGPTSGEGFVFALAPAGDLTIGLVGADGGACQQVSGGWGSGDGGITVPVLDDAETLVLVSCP
jgi:hypothetical protein